MIFDIFLGLKRMLDSDDIFYENQKRRKIEKIWEEHSYFRKPGNEPGPSNGPVSFSECISSEQFNEVPILLESSDLDESTGEGKFLQFLQC